MDAKQKIFVAVDAVVFGYIESKLQVLLIKQKYGVMKGKWVLPGGFVKDEEGLTDAVKRELKEETGITVSYHEQLYTFGDDVKRDPRLHVVSVAYLTLVNPSKHTLKADTDAEDAQWFDVNKLPKLGYDHNKIIKVGLERLKGKLTYEPIGFDLLDKEFPFSDLENLYGTILGKEIDRRNFRKKMLSFDLLQETEKMRKEGSGRPAKLFTFNKQKYKRLAKEGFHFEIKYV
ncbi:NUDIX hydrolase [Paracrocinitomix mangrovi]|uniref:NUDIX hydrolase n=1 Tax=Paracrocinitomix mangrovi TaxID=2862509 RepID=UPI001C8EC09F|nr:NUDIX domain-containing protein [Paracrocinitomix mangrovi]UKN00766.1 NUDIX hydrolase [Paracrocinitomix mangrovi]